MTDDLMAPLPATHGRAALHNALDALLDAMSVGSAPALPEHVEAFWGFVMELAGERGLNSFYHAEGLNAANATPASPEVTFNDRQKVNYHAALLGQFLMDAGGNDTASSILPGNFDLGSIVADVLWMVEGGPFGNKQKPQILLNPSLSNGGIHRIARETAVMEIARRSGATGQTVTSLLDQFGITKQQWDGWVRHVGMDEKAAAARARGEAHPAGTGLTDDELHKRIAEARKTGKGRATE